MKRVYDLRKRVYRLLMISSEGPWVRETIRLGPWDRDRGTKALCKRLVCKPPVKWTCCSFEKKCSPRPLLVSTNPYTT